MELIGEYFFCIKPFFLIFNEKNRFVLILIRSMRQAHILKVSNL